MMRSFPIRRVSLCAFVALASAAFFPSVACAGLNPGDILLNDLGVLSGAAHVQRYNPAGTLLNTYTGAGVPYEGVAVTPGGDIVVTRRSPVPGVDIFSPNGAQITSFDTPGITFPGDISVFADGVLAISDGSGHAIRLYDQSGHFIRSLTTGNLGRPFGSAVSPIDNTIYVTDIDSNTIFSFTEGGSGIGGLFVGFSVSDLVVDPTDGTLWVASRFQSTIRHMTPLGDPLGSFNISMAGEFDGIGMTSDGQTLYATTAAATAVNRFNRSGTLLGSFNIVSPDTPFLLTVVPNGVGQGTATPEPASLALLTLAGLPMMGLVSRKRR